MFVVCVCCGEPGKKKERIIHNSVCMWACVCVQTCVQMFTMQSFIKPHSVKLVWL